MDWISVKTKVPSLVPINSVDLRYFTLSHRRLHSKNQTGFTEWARRELIKIILHPSLKNKLFFLTTNQERWWCSSIWRCVRCVSIHPKKTYVINGKNILWKIKIKQNILLKFVKKHGKNFFKCISQKLLNKTQLSLYLMPKNTTVDTWFYSWSGFSLGTFTGLTTKLKIPKLKPSQCFYCQMFNRCWNTTATVVTLYSSGFMYNDTSHFKKNLLSLVPHCVFVLNLDSSPNKTNAPW